jgi:ketosteroid isomerase-like protein
VLRLKNTPLILFTLLFTLTTACQTQTTPATTTDTRAADESAIRTADIEWSKAAGTKDVEKTIAFYSADAIVMPPNSPQATGKESIRAIWKGLLGAPGFSGGWKPAKVEVAKSSDIAYVTGTYEFTENDASGKPMTDKGKYVEVWKKQTDGSWKCAVDIFNSDLPVSAAENKAASEKSK